MIAYIFLIFLVLFAPMAAAQAGEADVIGVKIEKQGDSTYQFDVTLFHKDEGWGHYADKWDIVEHDGTVIGTRILHHPHVHEQPFTRSLSGVTIPQGIDEVIVRAHDSVHEYGGKAITVTLP